MFSGVRAASVTGWLLVVILFLWVSGGLGWIAFYEVQEEKEFTGLGSALVMAVWPLFGAVAAVTQVWDSILALAGGKEEL